MYRSRRPSLRRLLAAALGTHLHEFRRRVKAAREELGTAAVHKLRVAGRRLRNACTVFAGLLPRRRARHWCRAIRRVTRELGAARNLDVQLEYLQTLRPPAARRGRKETGPGLERLALRLAQRRAELQTAARQELDRLHAGGTLRQMQRWLARRSRRKCRKEGSAWPAAGLALLVCQFVGVRSFAPFVPRPHEVEKLHQLRIAVKHLRYTMEALAPLFRKRLAAPLALVKTWQAQLGDLHDCDVWLASLAEFREQERQRYLAFFGHDREFSELEPGIEFVERCVIQQRAELHTEFVSSWNEPSQGRVWAFLASPPEKRRNRRRR